MTLDRLHGRWDARDHRYGLRKVDISDDLVKSVRAWRLHEAQDLPEPARSSAEWEASQWDPPAPRRA